jgi:hypothetical protein
MSVWRLDTIHVYTISETPVGVIAEEHDIIVGAEQIAQTIYGDRNKRRQVYHLAERGHLPIFRLGQTLCVRRSTLNRFIADQEQAALLSKRSA